MFLGFNMNPTYNKSGAIVQSPFTDINVRTAFSYAFDYDTFIDNVVNGFGAQLQGPIPQGMFGHDDDLFMFDYDLDEAQDAWNTAMADGLNDVWENASYELTIFYNSGNTAREAACLLMKDGLTALLAMDGTTQPDEELDITVQPLEWANYLYQVQHRQLPIFFLGWAPDYADPDNYVGPFVKSTGTYPMRIGLGISDGWDAEEVDGWISAAAQEQNENTRRDLYYDI
jgi:peptide/nickel transport system substrate-binding protein